LLFLDSIALYFTAGFSLLYLVVAVLSGSMIVFASWRLMISGTDSDAWRLYKISAFPYLGLIFLVMGLDALLL
jgi:heme O synthase-like polyprenyltransferase